MNYIVIQMCSLSSKLTYLWCNIGNLNADETVQGYEVYSSTIADVLSEPSLHTPMTVGLFARWGSGKSFLIGRLRSMLSVLYRYRPWMWYTLGCVDLQQVETLLFCSWSTVSMVSILFRCKIDETYLPKLTAVKSYYILAYLHTLLPRYTLTCTRWSTNQFFLDVPQFSTEFGKRLFSYLALTVCNGLPLNIRLLPTSDPFKLRLKIHLFK